jgi:hypothetical protein
VIRAYLATEDEASVGLWMEYAGAVWCVCARARAEGAWGAARERGRSRGAGRVHHPPSCRAPAPAPPGPARRERRLLLPGGEAAAQPARGRRAAADGRRSVGAAAHARAGAGPGAPAPRARAPRPGCCSAGGGGGGACPRPRPASRHPPLRRRSPHPSAPPTSLPHPLHPPLPPSRPDPRRASCTATSRAKTCSGPTAAPGRSETLAARCGWATRARWSGRRAAALWGRAAGRGSADRAPAGGLAGRPLPLRRGVAGRAPAAVGAQPGDPRWALRP